MSVILLLEDDRDLALTVIDHLELEGFTCDYAVNGIEGCHLIEKNQYAAILLDINMPGMDGLSFCQHLRDTGHDTPVLMLTAKDTLDDKMAGFSVGTDDYLVKPFEIEELIARVRVLSNRRSGQVNMLAVGDIAINLSERCGYIRNTAIKLTPTNLKILETLMRNSPQPISHQTLNNAVWGDESPDSNSLRVHIHNLRKTLNQHHCGDYLKTVQGFGFSIAKP